MSERHVEAVASVHAAELSEDFLPSLGRSFLVRSYYPAMLRDPYACVLVALENPSHRVVGFVNVATEPSRYLGWFLWRRAASVSAAMLRLCLAHPKRVLEAFAIVRTRVALPMDAGEIAFIAVDRDHQKRGVGEKLVEAANQYLLQRGSTACFTKTLASNEHVVDFYRKRWGARVFASSTIRGKGYQFVVWELRAGAGDKAAPSVQPRRS